MNKVYFSCDWGKDAEFLENLSKQTPNEKNKWGEIKAVNRAESSDFHVAFNKPSEKLDSEKLILFCMEPPANTRCDGWGEINALKKLPLSNLYKPQRWFINKTYDELRSLDPLDKKKNLSWITTDKGRGGSSYVRKLRRLILKTGYKKYKTKKFPRLSLADQSLHWTTLPGEFDGHILRMDFLDRLVNQYPAILDLYGRGDFSFSCYKGEVHDKWDGLKDYRYTLAIENYRGENYFSEKLTDALMSWCMPIYWGCTNIDDFLPEDSYVWVDIEDENAPERIEEIVESDLREQNLEAIAEARQRLLDVYQVWPTVEKVITNT